MSIEITETANTVSRIADRYLGSHASADRAFEWIHNNPELWKERVGLFESSVSEINRMISDCDFPEKLVHIKEIYRLTGGEKIPYIQDFNMMDPVDCQLVVRTLQNAEDNWETDWGFWLDDVEKPERVATGMFIELYGQYLDDMYTGVNMRQEVVYAIEEVLIYITQEDEINNNPLITDIKSWIQEELDTALNNKQALPMSKEILTKIGLNPK